jgi:hypothetical protein
MTQSILDTDTLIINSFYQPVPPLLNQATLADFFGKCPDLDLEVTIATVVKFTGVGIAYISRNEDDR